MKRLTKRQRRVLRKWRGFPMTAYRNATVIEWNIAKKLARRGYLDGYAHRLYTWPGDWVLTPKGLAAL